MKAGDTFFIQDRNVDSHLWVVISDTAHDSERVVIVSVTTYETYKEGVCLFEPGDHPRISHTSCVAYNETRKISLEKLVTLNAQGHLSVQSPVSTEILRRIRDGVSKSKRIPFQFVEILIEQGVID